VILSASSCVAILSRELEHLQFHPQCQKKQVECKPVRELGICALQVAIVVPLL
jgi:hypothetical protein